MELEESKICDARVSRLFFKCWSLRLAWIGHAVLWLVRSTVSWSSFSDLSRSWTYFEDLKLFTIAYIGLMCMCMCVQVVVLISRDSADLCLQRTCVWSMKTFSFLSFCPWWGSCFSELISQVCGGLADCAIHRAEYLSLGLDSKQLWHGHSQPVFLLRLYQQVQSPLVKGIWTKWMLFHNFIGRGKHIAQKHQGCISQVSIALTSRCTRGPSLHVTIFQEEKCSKLKELLRNYCKIRRQEK